MRIEDIYEGSLKTKRTFLVDYKDLILPPTSNAITTAALAPILAPILASYGLPVAVGAAGIASAVAVSAGIGLTIGAVLHYLKRDKRSFIKSYDEFTTLVMKRDLLIATQKKLQKDQYSEYKLSIKPPISDVKKRIKLVGSRLIKLLDNDKSGQEPDDVKRFKNNIINAYTKSKPLLEQVEHQLDESAIVLGIGVYTLVNKYLKTTGSSRIKNMIEKIESSKKPETQLAMYRKLQTYVAWDYVEDRIDIKTYRSQTIGIMNTMTAIKNSQGTNAVE